MPRGEIESAMPKREPDSSEIARSVASVSEMADGPPSPPPPPLPSPPPPPPRRSGALSVTFDRERREWRQPTDAAQRGPSRS